MLTQIQIKQSGFKRGQIKALDPELFKLSISSKSKIINIIITHADWLNEEHLRVWACCQRSEREREREKEMHAHATLSLTLSLFISLSPSLSLTCEQGAHTLFTGQRERESEKEERDRELLFLFLKGIMGALAPFSYLVYLGSSSFCRILIEPAEKMIWA